MNKADPFAAWRTALPFGTSRVEEQRDGAIAAVDVERSLAHRGVVAHRVFVVSTTGVSQTDGAVVRVHFDREEYRRQAVFEPARGTDPDAGTRESEGGPLLGESVSRKVFVEEVVVEMSAAVAAGLAQIIVARLAADAPAALDAVGIKVGTAPNG
jgi:hypothetical protein